MKQLQQNAASIPTNLGEGYYGYLVLIISDKQLKNILGTIPFVKPVDSGVFITAVTTNAVIAIKMHNGMMNFFCVMNINSWKVC